MALSARQFVESLSSNGILSSADLTAIRDKLSMPQQAADAQELAKELIRAGKLTKYQAANIYQGRGKGLVFGEYVVLDKLGAGGMGQVFKAQHRRMKRIVALKVLPPHATTSPAHVKRFYQEVEVAAKLIHPNIVTAFDAGESHGLHYLVMEYVDGQDLAAVLSKQGPLSVEQATSVILQAARGLAYAHQHGVVHRDIKPSNLLVDRKSGAVKILDLGLARLQSTFADDTQGREELTESGQVMGTIDYMAPEQANDTRTADHRADIYSLGCTLYRLLTGKLPFGGETTMQKFLAHREQPIPSLRAARPEIPDALERLYQKMLAKRPDDRPSSVETVVKALESLQTGVTSESSSISIGEDLPPPADVGTSFLASSSAPGQSTVPFAIPTATVVSASDGSIPQVETGSNNALYLAIAALLVACVTGWWFVGGFDSSTVITTTDGGDESQPVVSAPNSESENATSDAKSGGLITAVDPKSEAAPAPPSGPMKEPARNPTASALPFEEVNLLEIVDLKRDVHSGTWVRDNDGSLSAQDSKQSGIVQFSPVPPAEYDLYVDLELTQTSSAAIGLVVGSSQVGYHLVLAGTKKNAPPNRAGLGHIGDKAPLDEGNPTKVDNPFGLTDGRTTKLVFQVRPTSVSIVMNDRPVGQWSGDPQQLSPGTSIALADRTRLSLRADPSSKGSVRFSRCVLLPPGAQPRVRLPSEGLDLLKLADLKRDIHEGQWTFDGTTLASTDRINTIWFAQAPPVEYDLHIEAETVNWSNQVHVGLVVGTSRVFFGMMQASTPDQCIVGLDMHGGKAFTDATNPTHKKGVPGFVVERPMAIVCQVRSKGIHVLLNDQPILNWNGDPAELSVSNVRAGPDPTKLFLSAVSHVRFTRYELLPPGGTPRPKTALDLAAIAGEPTKPGPRVNLLRLIDPKRDGIVGLWEFQAGALMTPTGGPGNPRLQIPYALPKDYDLRIVAEPLGAGPFNVGLVVGSSYVNFAMNLDKMECGLENVQNANTLTKILQRISRDVPITLHFRVRPTSVDVTVNSQTLIRWKGIPKDLSFGGSWTAGVNKTMSYIGSYNNNRYRITMAELLPGSGDPLPLPATDAVAAAQPKVKEIAGNLPANATLVQRASAAANLQLEATKTDDFALRYALLVESLKMAAAADDLKTVMWVIEDLARCFQVDAPTTLTATLGEIGARTRPANDRKELVLRLLEAAEEQSAGGRYEFASLLVKNASTAVAKLPDVELKKEVANCEKEADESQKLAVAAEGTRKTLAEKPDDAEANLSQGLYLSIVRDDWTSALPYLAKGSEPMARVAAQAEMQLGQDLGRAVDVAGNWIEAADKAILPAKAVYFERARQWLSRSGASPTGPALAKLQTRYKKVEADVRRLAGTAFVKRHPKRAATFNGHWYEFVSDKLTWHEAQKHCQERGGNLVCLETAAETQWIYQFAASQFGKPDVFYFWIGATEEGHDGVFTWVTGAPVQFADWNSNEPDTSPGGEVVIVDRLSAGTTQFKWSDRAPTPGYAFICEWDR